MRKILLFLSLLIFIISCSQSKSERIILGEKYAKSELEKTLNPKNEHNVIDNKSLIITNKETAVKIAETILFEIYGKKNIENQKPYEIYKFENFYVILGTIPKNSVGGTFIIIIDGTNSKILKISHGK